MAGGFLDWRPPSPLDRRSHKHIGLPPVVSLPSCFELAVETPSDSLSCLAFCLRWSKFAPTTYSPDAW